MCLKLSEDIGLRYSWGYVDKIYKHSECIKSLYILIRGFKGVSPGQFIMLWMPGLEEIPLSPSYYNGSIMRITVMKRGETTEAIHRLRKGDRVYFRGPYGRGFSVRKPGKYMLVGGGYGAAPVIYTAYKIVELGYEATYIEGVKSSRDALFIKEAEDLGLNTVLVTEDGSSGVKGLVTNYIDKIIDEYDHVIGCGPEGMLLRLIDLCTEHNVDCQLSFEAMVKCGIGLCGSCELWNTGYLICRDGPVFNAGELYKYVKEVTR